MSEKEFEPVMVRLSALPYAESLSLLLYGGPGAGKTYLAGTAGPRFVILNAGNGIVTLQSPDFRDRFPYDPWIINIPKDCDRFNYLCDTIDYLLTKRRADFDGIILDDCSALSRYAMRKAVEVNKDLKKSGTLEASKKYRGILAPDVTDYGEEITVIEWFLAEYTDKFKEQNIHFIAIAHERHIYGKAAKIGDARPLKKITLGFTGQTFPDKIPAFFDEVWNMEAVGKGDAKKYRINTKGHSSLTGKTRHGGVFKEIEDNLTFPIILQRIKANKYIPDPNNPELLIAVKG